MGYFRQYNKLFVDVLEKLSNTSNETNTSSQLDSVLEEICEVFTAKLVFVYEKNNHGGLSLLSQFKTGDCGVTLKEHVQSTKEIELLFAYTICMPSFDVDENIVSYMGLGSENSFSDEIIQDINSIFITIGNYLKIDTLQTRLNFHMRSLEDTLDNSPVDIYVADYKTNKILYANKSIKEHYFDKQGVVGKKCWELFYDEEKSECDDCPKKNLVDESGVPTGSYDYEFERPIDNEWLQVSHSAFNWVDGRLAHIVTAANITEQKKNQSIIEHMAFYDSLTNIPNRRKFEVDFKTAIERTIESKTEGYILFLDLDHFKQINDIFGHEAGDHLLLQASQYINTHTEFGGHIYRYGGDEFILFFEQTDREYVSNVANTIVSKFGEAWHIGANEIFCTASIGIACFPHDGILFDDLLQSADKAMYNAKLLGKNTVAFHRPFHEPKNMELDKQYAIRRAVLDNFRHFQVYAHPIIDAKTNACIGAEALVRWHSVEYGVLRPKSFIPICEQLGLLSQLDQWVLKQSLLKSKEFLAHNPDFFVSINVSRIYMQEVGYADMVLENLKISGCNPNQIMIEITETLADKNEKAINTSIKKLRENGIKVAVDGFGMGHLSLKMLTDSEYDLVKIDRSFIMKCLETDFDRTFANAIVALAHSANRAVCAEGVWNEEIKTFLSENDYDYLQGTYFAKPVPISEFYENLEVEK